MANRFGVDVRMESGTPLLAVSGELDLASTPSLEAELERVRESAPTLIIIDLRQLEFDGLDRPECPHPRPPASGAERVQARHRQRVPPDPCLLTLTGVADRLTIVERPEDLSQTG